MVVVFAAAFTILAALWWVVAYSDYDREDTRSIRRETERLQALRRSRQGRP